MLTNLVTERLVLRPFTLADVDAAYEMQLDPEVTRFTHDGGVQPREAVRQRIEQDVLGDYERWGYGRFAVEQKSDGRFVGFCGLKYLDDVATTDLGYRFARDVWGQGYATESGAAALAFGFRQLELSEVIAMALRENSGSFRVMAKLGMRQVATWEEPEGVVVKYAITRDEWRASCTP